MGRQSGSKSSFRGNNRHRVKQAEVNWPTGKLVKVMNIINLPNLEITPKIERCEYVASYNWLDNKNHPTILVPTDASRITTVMVTVKPETAQGRFGRIL
jgi:hypothetical protein